MFERHLGTGQLRLAKITLAALCLCTAIPAHGQYNAQYEDGYGGVAPIIENAESFSDGLVLDPDASVSAAEAANAAYEAVRLDLNGTFKMLDKVTGRVQLIRLPADETVSVASLEIVMRDCVTAPPEEAPETKAFVEISEVQDDGLVRLFTGWMFASSPGLNALEHAVYDFWPVVCKRSDGAIFSGSE